MKRAVSGALLVALLFGGWLSRGYWERPSQARQDRTGAAASRGSADPGFDPGDAFRSREACRAALAAGKRAPRVLGRARFGSWNLHWFPDGKPGKKASQGGTDLKWLACAIAWLTVDVLAVQEMKAHPLAQQKAGELISELDRLTKGKWRLVLDDCKADAGQHVGFLFDEARVSMRLGQTFAALNPHGEACKDQLRPGYGAYFRFPGGLDLHAVSVHLKSGTERRALELRERSFQKLGEVYAAARAGEPDSDLVFLGDFNTMGCGHCSPKVSPSQELGTLSGAIQPAKLRQVPAALGCSHYFSGRGTLLDLAVISSSTAELAADARVSVAGVCGAAQCRSFGEGQPRLAAFEALSDHCPILLDLSDRDLD